MLSFGVVGLEVDVPGLFCDRPFIRELAGGTVESPRLRH